MRYHALKWYAEGQLETSSGYETKESWSENYDNYFKCVLLAFTQDLLRCHEPEVSVEADTGQLRDVSLADTVWHQEEWDW